MYDLSKHVSASMTGRLTWKVFFVCPSIFFLLIRVGSWWRQVKQHFSSSRLDGLYSPSKVLGLFQGLLLEHFQRKAPRRHPPKEQRLYSELPPDVRVPRPIAKAEPGHPAGEEAHFAETALVPHPPSVPSRWTS